MESVVRIEFVYDQNPEEAFGTIIEYATSHDDIGCWQNGTDRSVELKGGLLGATVSLRDSKMMQQVYSYENNIISLLIPCDDLAYGGDYDREAHPYGYYGTELVEMVIEFTRQVYQRTDPAYVFGIHSFRKELVGIKADHAPASPVTDAVLAGQRVVQPTWLMVLPPALVDRYGREWLHYLPADRIEDLDDGGMLIVAVEDLTDCETDEELVELITEAVEPLETAFERVTL